MLLQDVMIGSNAFPVGDGSGDSGWKVCSYLRNSTSVAARNVVSLSVPVRNGIFALTERIMFSSAIYCFAPDQL
jgi:hypothetical protein